MTDNLTVNEEKENIITSPDGKARHYDPNFKGPIKNRSCTDIPCCLLFTLYLVGMVIVGIIAFKEGDLDRLIYPTDSNGKTCGVDFVDKKYLFFFDLTKCIKKTSLKDLTSLSCPTPQVCVEKCPNYTAVYNSDVDYDKVICVEGVTRPQNKREFDLLVKENKCADFYIDSSPVLYRCLPTAVGLDNLNSTEIKKNIENGISGLGDLMNAKGIAVKIFEDLKMVWYWILGALVIAMFISLLWIIITRWIAWPMVWLSILAAFALMIVGIYFCYHKYKDLEDRGVDKSIEWKFTTNLDNFTNSKKFWLASGIILTVVFVVLFLIMLVLRKRINISIALIKEASKAVGSIKAALFFPIFPWILQLGVFAWFIAVALFLVSNGTQKFHVIDKNGTIQNFTDCNPKTFTGNMSQCVLAGYETNEHLYRMAIFHFFGWLWMMNFVIALGECVLAGAFASWYFAFHKPDDVPALPIISALGRTIRYHTGSLAFGAAIIAIVQFIRAVLEYIHHKLKESNQDNGFVKFFMRCLKCCFWCLEKCLRYLNKNVYIGIAIYGKNFCKAAKDAFFLLLRNALRVAAINGVTAFLLFMGRLFVVGVIGVASFYWFDKFVNDVEDVQLSYSVVPIVVCVIGAWVVAALFFSVYEMAIDTIFFCFLEDCERNDGSAEKPYYMSDNLRDILGK
ncbi:choline transporter-like protein 4 isoform X2 [Xenia sp. Carnegie-2017]|uniref:choline transporter-like protein 4 isoform X2 n=1 Tax=Xenia sp. Carnegie-2017 TaxID=2897299 RepID=UPI001F03BC08|nr:choline transporter-like protein 4 isoform X2 [Xenia sp. Carnegie-2017]